MNKFLQWLQSIKSRVTDAFSFGKDPAPVPPVPREDPDARRERIIRNVFPISTKPGATHQAVDLQAGLSEEAKAFAAQPAPSTMTAEMQYAFDQNTRDLIAGDSRAKGILTELVLHQPLFKDFHTRSGDGREQVFRACDRVRSAGLSGNDIGALYDICHQNPVKMLGVFYATEFLGIVDSSKIKSAIAVFDPSDTRPPSSQSFAGLVAPGADPLPVDKIFQGLVDEIPQIRALPGPTGEHPKDISKGPPTYKFDDLMADLKSGKFMERTEARFGDFSKPQNSRPTVIEPGDTPAIAINKLSFGDEQARRILAQITSTAEMVDRDSVNGAMGPLMSLDSLGITGGDITSLHKACGSHAFATVAVLRAHQLGFVSDEQIEKVAYAPPGENKGGADVRDLDVNGLILQVTEALPNFSYPAALMGGRQPGGAPPVTGAGGNPIPSVPVKIKSVQPPQPGQGKGGVDEG